MNKNVNANCPENRQLHNVNRGELESITGGVAPVFDDKGNIIRTCTGPFPPIKSGVYYPKTTPRLY